MAGILANRSPQGKWLLRLSLGQQGGISGLRRPPRRRSDAGEKTACPARNNPTRGGRKGNGRCLNVAQVDSLAQRSERIARGDKFVGHVAVIVGGQYAAHDAIPLDFLGAVE